MLRSLSGTKIGQALARQVAVHRVVKRQTDNGPLNISLIFVGLISMAFEWHSNGLSFNWLRDRCHGDRADALMTPVI